MDVLDHLVVGREAPDHERVHGQELLPGFAVPEGHERGLGRLAHVETVDRLGDERIAVVDAGGCGTAPGLSVEARVGGGVVRPLPQIAVHVPRQVLALDALDGVGDATCHGSVRDGGQVLDDGRLTRAVRSLHDHVSVAASAHVVDSISLLAVRRMMGYVRAWCNVYAYACASLVHSRPYTLLTSF